MCKWENEWEQANSVASVDVLVWTVIPLVSGDDEEVY